MAENHQDQTQTPKAYILSFPYRHTGMGGFDDTILVSLRTKKTIKSLLRTTRSGNHGTRSYRLFPGKYLMYEVQRSNGGNLYGFVKIIRLKDDGQIETEQEWKVFVGEPTMSLDDLPSDIATILMENKEELPLFREVFPFDTQDTSNEEGE